MLEVETSRTDKFNINERPAYSKKGMNGYGLSSTPVRSEIRSLRPYIADKVDGGKDKAEQKDPRYTDALTAFRQVIDKPGMTLFVDNTGNTPNKFVMRALQERCSELREKYPKWKGHILKTRAVLHTAFEEDFTNEDIYHEALFVGGDMRNAVRKGLHADVIKNPDGTQMRLEEFSLNLMNNNLRPDAVLVTLSPVIKEGEHKGKRTMGVKGADMVEVFNKIKEEQEKGVPAGKEPIKIIALERELPVPELGEAFIKDDLVDKVVKTTKVEHKKKAAKENPEAEAIAKYALGAIIKVWESKFKNRKKMAVQCGLGGITEVILPGLIDYCDRNGIDLHVLTEVASKLVDRLADEGKLANRTITSFTYEIEEENIAKNPGRYVLLGTSKVNNETALWDHLRELGRGEGEDGNPVFIAINQATEIGLPDGRSIAGQVPDYTEDGVKSYIRQGGPGGQGVMMKEAYLRGDISVILPKARRKGRSGITFDTNGAEVTTPGEHVRIYASEIGSFERIPLTDVTKAEEVRQANMLGIINNVAAPEFREELIETAREKGLLPQVEKKVAAPAMEAKPVTVFDLFDPKNYVPYNNPIFNAGWEASWKTGMQMYNKWMKAIVPAAYEQTA